MNLRTIALAGTALLGVLAATTHAQNAETATPESEGQEMEPLGVDGSGTTNPSKCFWHIMAKFNEQIKVPTTFSYRAVGSGTGQKEFLGKSIPKGFPDSEELEDTGKAYNDFGSGDIPISKVDKEKFNAAPFNNDFVQLPFVLSAVTFFHSLPGVPPGPGGLNMTACLLARVFQAEITNWDHPDILAINPGLSVEKDKPIFVGRRKNGSSSTYSMTHYLRAQCPQTEAEPNGWPEDKTASKIEWHPSTHECDGSGYMTSCLEENEGAIGYIDSNHGHEALLTEIRISNGDGKFITTKDVGKEGIQAAARDLTDVPIPEQADGDFSKVQFYNKKGENTWPIALISYVYVRKDLSFIKNPRRRTLLKAFLQALFDPEYINLCDRFGHIPVPEGLKKISEEGIEMVNWDATSDQEWLFETEDTLAGWGQGDYVISARRQNFGLYEADRLADDVKPLAEDLRQLKLELASLQASTRSGAADAFKGGLVFGLSALVGTLMLGFY